MGTPSNCRAASPLCKAGHPIKASDRCLGDLRHLSFPTLLKPRKRNPTLDALTSTDWEWTSLEGLLQRQCQLQLLLLLWQLLLLEAGEGGSIVAYLAFVVFVYVFHLIEAFRQAKRTFCTAMFFFYRDFL